MVSLFCNCIYDGHMYNHIGLIHLSISKVYVYYLQDERIVFMSRVSLYLYCLAICSYHGYHGSKDT
jgi:hypothetical protein